MRLLLTAAVLLSAALAAGCGGDSEADKIESVLRGYITHYVESEPAEMYALLNAGSRGRCSEDDFIAFITRARAALGERDFEVVEVRDIAINGDSATATVHSRIDGEEAEPTENTLLKEDGAWKLELPSPAC
jgi:hypothetical protein